MLKCFATHSFASLRCNVMHTHKTYLINCIYICSAVFSMSTSPMVWSSSSLPLSLSSSASLLSLSIFSASSRSSRSLTARASSLITIFPLLAAMQAPAFSTAAFTSLMPNSLSRVCVVMTYSGEATRLTRTLQSSVDTVSAARIASLMRSTPSYAKHVSSMSARTLSGCGVMRRRMSFTMASFTVSFTAGTRAPVSSGRVSSPKIASGFVTMNLNASNAWPYFLYSGHPM
mmetsp:Transcript_23870/g.58517  ORF Transcript_23870/g.58517 Transcript_23870/m.58517 type:complete len:230 (-) Transcript_23870:528-1217(-)